MESKYLDYKVRLNSVNAQNRAVTIGAWSRIIILILGSLIFARGCSGISHHDIYLYIGDSMVTEKPISNIVRILF